MASTALIEFIHDFRYHDNIEVFCPNDNCNNAPFAPLPYGLTGASGAFSKGVAFVCGGARTFYKDCTAKVSGNYCLRNAECVTTAGNALWCTGPKITTCHVYDRYLTRSWLVSPTGLLTARSHAASVILPDGRVWILGGAGSSSVLKSTEFVSIGDNGISSVIEGPALPEPLMGHCAATLTVTQVMVIGGYSTVINDYSPVAYIYDFTSNQWITDRTLAAGKARIDGSCIGLNIGGVSSVLMVGGWNNLILPDTGAYSSVEKKWTFFNGTGGLSVPMPTPTRSSILIERNKKYFLIGGVSCDANGRSCKQTDTSKSLSHTYVVV